MEWISLKKASELTGRPERTLRYYAATAKIRVRKEGKFWLCDLKSLETLEGKKFAEVPQAVTGDISPPAPSKETYKSPSSVNQESKKYRRLEELGVYAEILDFLKEHRAIEPKHSREIDAIHEFLKEALYDIGLGFYEYDKTEKAQLFKLARSHLVRALIFTHERELAETAPLADKIENSFLPGVIGLIRKAEMRKKNERVSTNNKP